MNAPTVDVRVERPGSYWEWIGPMMTATFMCLVRIDLDPPRTGPEIELTFITDLPEATIRETLSSAGLVVLAVRGTDA